MGLADEEADYFRALVRACHGPTAAEREAATALVKEIRARHGFPKRKRGRPLRAARPDVEAQTVIEARARALAGKMLDLAPEAQGFRPDRWWPHDRAAAVELIVANAIALRPCGH